MSNGWYFEIRRGLEGRPLLWNGGDCGRKGPIKRAEALCVTPRAWEQGGGAASVLAEKLGPCSFHHPLLPGRPQRKNRGGRGGVRVPRAEEVGSDRPKLI